MVLIICGKIVQNPDHFPEQSIEITGFPVNFLRGSQSNTYKHKTWSKMICYGSQVF